MQFRLTMSDETFRLALADLRDLAESTASVPYASGLVCSTVANLIAAAGPYGGSAQAAAMHAADAVGFSPEFYAGGIRVSYVPAPKEKLAG